MNISNIVHHSLTFDYHHQEQKISFDSNSHYGKYMCLKMSMIFPNMFGKQTTGNFPLTGLEANNACFLIQNR